MTETVSPEMVERMIALVRDIASIPSAYSQREAAGEWQVEAIAIAAELPAPVDADEQYARDLIKAQGWSGEPSIGGEAVVLMIATAHRDGRTLATQGDR